MARFGSPRLLFRRFLSVTALVRRFPFRTGSRQTSLRRPEKREFDRLVFAKVVRSAAFLLFGEAFPGGLPLAPASLNIRIVRFRIPSAWLKSTGFNPAFF